MDDKIRNIQSKFKIVYRECDFLEDKIFKKEGILFKTHKFTIEELMRSEHHNKINSVTNKIGSDISYWEMNGKLLPVEKETYLDERENLEDVLHQINRRIQNREPTLWEQISQAIEKFVVKIMSNLPAFREVLTYIGKQMGRIPYIGKVFPLLIHMTRKTTHLLTDVTRKTTYLLTNNSKHDDL